MRKSPPGIQIMDPRFDCPGVMCGLTSSPRAGRLLSAYFCGEASPAVPACPFSTSKGLSSRIGSWYEIERRSGRDEFLPLLAFLEFPHDTMRMLHHPPAHVT